MIKPSFILNKYSISCLKQGFIVCVKKGVLANHPPQGGHPLLYSGRRFTAGVRSGFFCGFPKKPHELVLPWPYSAWKKCFCGVRFGGQDEKSRHGRTLPAPHRAPIISSPGG